MSLTIPQYKVPTIYVYTTPYYKNKNWYQGTRDGKGIFTRRNGTKITGFWKDDNVVNIETIHRPLHYYERE